MVTKVALGSPAQEVGLERFDVIFEIDGKKIPDIDAFNAVVSGLSIGQSTTMQVFRLDWARGKMAGNGAKVIIPWVRKQFRIMPQTRETVKIAAVTSCPLSLLSARIGLQLY